MRFKRYRSQQKDVITTLPTSKFQQSNTVSQTRLPSLYSTLKGDEQNQTNELQRKQVCFLY